MTATPNFLSRISFGPLGTAIADFTNVFEALSCTVALTKPRVDSQGMSGTPTHHAPRTRDGLHSVAGQITAYVCPSQIDTLLPYMGFSESTNVFTPTDAVTGFDLLVDNGYKRVVYRGCKVTALTISGQSGNQLALTASVLGLTRDDPSDTAFPSIAQPSDSPYMFYDATATTFNSEDRELNDITISVDRQGYPVYRNSKTATEIVMQDRIVTVSTSIPYNADEHDLLTMATTGAAAIVTFTQGSSSLRFDFANWQPTIQDAILPGLQGEKTLQLSGQSRKSGSDPDIKITNVP